MKLDASRISLVLSPSCRREPTTLNAHRSDPAPQPSPKRLLQLAFFRSVLGVVAGIAVYGGAFIQPVLAQSCGVPPPDGDTPGCLYPIVPLSPCVDRNLDGSYTAHWGYESQRTDCCPPHLIPVNSTHPYERNYFTPGDEDRGQPTLFEPGLHLNAITTTWDGSPLTWTIRSFTLPAQGDPPQFYFENSATASANSPLCTPNQPPRCDTGGPYIGECGGTVTTLALDGSASSDPEGFPLSYHWVVTCNDPNVTLSDTSSPTPTLELRAPGNGVATSCTITLTVADGIDSSQCATSAEVSACPLDCEGTPYGSATLDQCGVCNGSDACLDCAGVPFGVTSLDRCGICGGDGSSCLDCSTTDITQLQLHLDGTSLLQLGAVKRAASRYRVVAGRTSRVRRFNQRVITEAQKIYTANWFLAYSLPSINLRCNNEIFCSSVDNSPSIAMYDQNATALHTLTKKVLRRLRRAGGRGRLLLRRADLYLKDNLGLSAQIPETQSYCE